MSTRNCMILLIAVFTFASVCQLSEGRTQFCDDEEIIIKNAIGNYYTNGYHPPQIENLWNTHNEFCASIKAAFQLCLDRPWILNPYSPNKENCLLGLRRSAELNQEFSKRAPVDDEIEPLADIVIQAQTDCESIFLFDEKTSFSDDCSENIDGFNDLLSDYDNDRILGGSGTQYLNDIAIYLRKQERICDYDSVVSPNTDDKDSCSESNDFLAAVIEKLLRYLDKKDYQKYSKFQRLFYQSAVRAARLCREDKHLKKLE
mmetsp:Transcript_29474/g.30589  ORF Transcript_29474/g.30589 Transcript_29474/m.30589 type:complete len:259 (-) Transcript_29474:81-857(-)